MVKDKLVPKLRFVNENEWGEFTLGAIGKTYSGLSGLSKDNFNGGNSKYITYKSIFDNNILKKNLTESVDLNNKSQNKVKKGDLFFTGSSETPEEVGMVSVLNFDIDDCYLNSFCFGYRLNDFKKISPTFLAYYLRSPIMRNKIQILAQGSTRFNLSKKETLKLRIKIPKMEEQLKISNFFMNIDKKIELLKTKHNYYEDFKKYLMQQIFAQKLRFDNFDREWEFKKLGQVSIVKDGTHDSPKYVPNGYPLITSKNLLNGEIDFENVNYISKEDYDNINKRSNVDKGDILFGMIGTIGNPLIVETDDFAIKNVALIKEKEELLNKFLIHVLETDFINKQFYRLNAGGTQKFIALGLIKDLLVPIPSIEEQLKISEFLSTVEINLNSYKNQISNMKKFKKGLLQQMFI